MDFDVFKFGISAEENWVERKFGNFVCCNLILIQGQECCYPQLGFSRFNRISSISDEIQESIAFSNELLVLCLRKIHGRREWYHL